MTIDSILWYSGTIGEAAVIALLLYRRMWRFFPVFLAYSIWTLIGNAIGYFLFGRHFSGYITVYLVIMLVDAALLFGVLVELAWSILRPLRASLPRSALLVVAALILALGAAIWPFVAFPGAAQLSPEYAALIRIQQTFSVLRVLVFLALAGCSQLLAIGWRNRELQIATGLGLNSLVGLAVAVLHTHQSSWVQYKNLNQLVVASYLCSLLYWIVAFSQQEAERREFSPQMQSLLLAVAGAARTSRIALADARTDKNPK